MYLHSTFCTTSPTPFPGHLLCSEAYPSCTVTDIRFCFDVNKLMRLDAERYFLCLFFFRTVSTFHKRSRSSSEVWNLCLADVRP